MLTRPDVPAREHYRPNKPKTGVAKKGTLQTQMSNEVTNGLAPSVLGFFSGGVKANSCVFPPMSEEDPRRATAGLHSRCAPEA